MPVGAFYSHFGFLGSGKRGHWINHNTPRATRRRKKLRNKR